MTIRTVYTHDWRSCREYEIYFREFLNIESTDTFEQADLILFTGGADVDPDLYGEPVHPETMTSFGRDEQDKAMFDQAILEEKPMVGICRGSQFLHVMMGGRLWQHVTRHTRPHSLVYKDTDYPMVTSTHHQQMRDIPTGSGQVEVLAAAEVEKSRRENGDEEYDVELGAEDEPQLEVVWYPDMRVLCFQPHPELAIYDKQFMSTHDLFRDVMNDTLMKENN